MHHEIGIPAGMAIVLAIGVSAGALVAAPGRRGPAGTLVDMALGTFGAFAVAFVLPMAGYPLARSLAVGVVTASLGALAAIGLARLAQGRRGAAHLEGHAGTRRMARVCRFVIGLFLVLYLGALFLFAAGTFGLFGSDTGPLAGIFLVPLGLPWNQFIDAFPEPAWPWLAAAAPVLNLLVLGLLCRIVRAWRT